MDLHKLTPWNWLRQEGSRNRFLPQRRALPALSRWDRDIEGWFDRMLDDMYGNSPMPPREVTAFRPKLDILEKPDQYLVTAELPGMEKSDLDITLDGQTLSLAGQKKEVREEDKDGYHYSERLFGQFQRLLTLPDDADAEHLNAVFHNGVLTLTIPRHEHREGGQKSVEIH
ncbi:MAG: Hsp20/alpha crystallin family protein [Alcanivorax sp.]|nr:Hsp20/alpha crystallin family protein [Alcanivorax sp.]